VTAPPLNADLGWLSFHITYHTGSRDLLLVDLVRPLLRGLLRDGRIDRAFFVRYSLGGPHIRLRLRPVAGGAGEVREIVRREAESFLRDHPSPAAMPEEKVRLLNQLNGSRDASESEDEVLPDNRLLEVPFQPETERYGGLELLPRSLDFFALSSARALQLLVRRALLTEGEWLAEALRLQARYVLGFARDLKELEMLTRIPQSATGERADFLRARADQAYAQSGERFVSLLRKEIHRLDNHLGPDDDCEAARRLARALATATDAQRASVFLSQIHMTLNRLGLRNVEEVYTARFLWRAVEQIREENWTGLGARLADAAAQPSGANPEIADLLLAGFL
jgi:hypothetical protein